MTPFSTQNYSASASHLCRGETCRSTSNPRQHSDFRQCASSMFRNVGFAQKIHNVAPDRGLNVHAGDYLCNRWLGGTSVPHSGQTPLSFPRRS